MAKIYLISPPEIDLKSFSCRLQKALKTNLVPIFQLRLKGYAVEEVNFFASELKKICHDNNCLLIVNDFFEVAIDVGADGVHLGVDDQKIGKIRSQVSKNFLIGASCYDSKEFAIEAKNQGANHISFGAFFPSKTKVSQGNPSLEIIDWAVDNLDLPIVTIGGINDQNCKVLAERGAEYIAVISYVWNNEIDEVCALKKINDQISAVNH